MENLPEALSRGRKGHGPISRCDGLFDLEIRGCFLEEVSVNLKMDRMSTSGDGCSSRAEAVVRCVQGSQ